MKERISATAATTIATTTATSPKDEENQGFDQVFFFSFLVLVRRPKRADPSRCPSPRRAALLLQQNGSARCTRPLPRRNAECASHMHGEHTFLQDTWMPRLAFAERLYEIHERELFKASHRSSRARQTTEMYYVRSGSACVVTSRSEAATAATIASPVIIAQRDSSSPALGLH